jgi:hypothetical protein
MKSICIIPVLVSILILGSVGLTQQASAFTAFSTDFNSGVPSEFTGYTSNESVQDFDTVGLFTEDFLRNNSGNLAGNPIPSRPTILTLTDLPPHTGVDINFLLAMIDSWDGTASTCGAEHGIFHPDIFSVKVDGVTILSEKFDNAHCGTQTYISPAGVDLARYVDLGFSIRGDFDFDSAYDMGLDPRFDNIAHTSPTLTIEWEALASFSGHTDESWAIDNVEIILQGTTPSITCGADTILDDGVCVVTQALRDEITDLETALATALANLADALLAIIGLEAEVEELGQPGAPVANQGEGKGIPAQGKNNNP